MQQIVDITATDNQEAVQEFIRNFNTNVTLKRYNQTLNIKAENWKLIDKAMKKQKESSVTLDYDWACKALYDQYPYMSLYSSMTSFIMNTAGV